MTATAAGNTLYLVATTSGARSNYAYTISGITSNPSNFSQSSFMYPALSGDLSGGADQNTTGGTVYSYCVPGPSNPNCTATNPDYDESGNLLGYVDSVMGTWNFGYDTLNRLITGTATSGSYTGQNACWSYDSFGNRTAQSLQTAACPSPQTDLTPTARYNVANQVTWTTVNSAVNGFSYDASGDVTDDNRNQYLYDAEGRVCAVATSGVGTDATIMTGYLYDADGTRVSKGTITTWSCDPATSGFKATSDYIVGLNGEQMTEMVPKNNTMVTAHANVWAGGNLLATYDSDGVHFYLNDPLGTRRIQTNYTGVVEQTCQSLPYGDGETCAPVPTEHLFTGKERDSESGNDYFGARYYGSSMGRFLSPDPAGVGYVDPSNPQSLNLYSYVYNNPLINIDPSGMECVWDDGSYDASDDPNTGSAKQCSGQGGTWVDPSLFESVEGNQAGSWSGQGSSQIQFDWLTPSATVNAGPWDFSTARAYLSLWQSGQLPTQLNYGPNDPATLAMINRPYVQAQLAAYAKAGCPANAPAGQGSFAAYGETAGDVASGNPNYVQAEVGGYSGHITTSGGVTTVTITNISGASSFWGYSVAAGAVNKAFGTHLNRNALDKTSGAERNVHQTFTWKEPSPCG